MPENNTKPFFVKGEQYDIPQDKIDAFKQDFPDAEEGVVFDVDGDSYTIPFSMQESFVKDFPGARAKAQPYKPDATRPLKREEIRVLFNTYVPGAEVSGVVDRVSRQLEGKTEADIVAQ